ncbi:MAG: endonuclease/exonuclease/phosphatase family protein [Candidatus Paceibacterales bacterium]
MKNLKLLVYNIAHGRGLSPYQGWHSERKIRLNLKKIANLFKAIDPHIIALQEVDEFSHWNRHLNLLEIMQTEANYPVSFLGVNRKRVNYRPLVYGNGVLSKFPIGFRENVSFGKTLIGGKGFLYVEFEVGGKVIPLINLHLDFLSKKQRVLQIEEVVKYIIERNKNTQDGEHLEPIICGDFNTHSGRQADAVLHLGKFLKQFSDYQLLPQGEKTFPAVFPYKTLDFIFLPARCEVKRCEVLKIYLSDHRPVVVEFGL